MNDDKLDCGCTWEHACDFHRTHSAYQGVKDHGSLPIDYKLYKKLEEIIERLSQDVDTSQAGILDMPFNYFKFEADYAK